MLVALSDTHCADDPELTPHLRTVIEEADCVLHTGDFVTETVFGQFETLARDIVAVCGNRDRPSLAGRLPETATTAWSGTRFLLAHGHRHDETSLSLLARQESADVILTGHTHCPRIGRLGEYPHINPGSHADPRGNRPAYAAFERENGEIAVHLRTPAGAEIERETL